MINIETLLLFCTTALVIIITPGPNQAYIITRSINQGRKAGILSVLGIDAGSLVHVVLASFGLSALLASSDLAFSIVRYAGAAYLIYLGIRTWMSRTDAFETSPSKRLSGKRIFLQGMLTNILNPKAALFFLAILPQFVNRPQGHVTEQMLLLGIIFNCIGLMVDLVVALLASSAGAWLRRRTRFKQFQRWAAGGVYVSLGLGTVWPGGESG